MDISTELGAALTGALAAFTGNVAVIVPVLAGIGVASLVIRRSLRFLGR